MEKAARDAGHDVTVPFSPGRTDASQEQTDVEAFAVLEPEADGFRNYIDPDEKLPAEHKFLDRAQPARADRPGDDGAIGGLRASARTPAVRGTASSPTGPAAHQRLLHQPARPAHGVEDVGHGGERLRGPGPGHRRARWTATAVDLVFGAHAQLRALAEVYASTDGKDRFVRDFVAAWAKVMDADRFDLA